MTTSLTPLPTEAAETLGLQALAWLASDPERAQSFFAASGGDIDSLRARAADPELLAFVLDFLISDETMLIAFCEQHEFTPDRPIRARAGLPGGADPHWT